MYRVFMGVVLDNRNYGLGCVFFIWVLGPSRLDYPDHLST